MFPMVAESEGPTAISINPFPLQHGSRGKKVEQLQLFLREKMGAQFPLFGIDGVFKDETLNKVKEFLRVDKVSEELFKEKRMTDFKTYQFA